MAIFARHSDKEYDALAKKLAAAEAAASQLTADKEALTAKAASFEKSQAVQKEENDLLLAQLHQVQEELEKYFLENKSHQEKLAAKDQELKTEKDKFLGKDQELASQKDSAAKAASALKAAQEAEATAKKKADELTAKLAEVEKKLSEANKLIKAEGDAKINEVQKQKADLEKKLADSVAASGAQKAELEQKLAAAIEAASKVKADFGAKEAAEADLKSENDLLLAQLHQVQEELEKYYLGNKELEASVAEAATLVKQLRHAMVRTLVDGKKIISFAQAKGKTSKKSVKAA